jgi:hypothetical protein
MTPTNFIVWDWPRGTIKILCDHLLRVTNEYRFSAGLILIYFDPLTVCGLG